MGRKHTELKKQYEPVQCRKDVLGAGRTEPPSLLLVLGGFIRNLK